MKAFDRIWRPKRWKVLPNWAAIRGERNPPINILFPFTDFYVWWALASCTMLFLWSLSELAWPAAAAYIFISHELSRTWLIGGRQAGRGSRQALQGTVTFILFLSTEIVLDSKAWERECWESFKSLSSFHAGYVVLRRHYLLQYCRSSRQSDSQVNSWRRQQAVEFCCLPACEAQA